MDTPPTNPQNPGQPTENVGDYPGDRSFDTPAVTPADNPNVVTEEPEQQDSYFSRVQDAIPNLAPSEIPTPDQLPSLVGVLLYAQDNNGELPGPLHERFPDAYPNPDND